MGRGVLGGARALGGGGMNGFLCSLKALKVLGVIESTGRMALKT